MEKKAQQEILGFVLIVSLVVVITVIFLGFSLRKPNLSADQQNIDVENFLTALFDYTTNCTLRTTLASMQDVIKACYLGQTCSQGFSACSYINSTLIEVLKLSFQQNVSLEIYSDSSVFSKKTACSSGYTSSQKLINLGETNLLVELRLCGMSEK
ncbi:hypothetical protein COV16_00590 [Candidatus Woesearchaeota archaeon CG10_big_fil_rev_8_21_14_0_10_34_8]|nr:MAG: hypothetical protein COV16_00590 [Candidatus Woesearchaeota archaeon CG10_big_fil_rev_8_21_14_0_10_34_8]